MNVNTSSYSHQDFAVHEVAVSPEVRQSWTWFIAIGLAIGALGIAAVAFPFVATLAIELLVGWLLVINGALGLVHALRSKRWQGFAFSMVGALLSLVVGATLVLFPTAGIISLTVLATIFLAAGGMTRIVMALRLRPRDRWLLLAASGVLGVLLAATIILFLPQAASWIIGILVGVDLAFAGAIMTGLGMEARRVDKALSES